MHTFSDSPTVYWDVDSTLVFTMSEAPAVFAPRTIQIRGRIFQVHVQHVEILKDFAARGHNVVVWSQGGAEWASDVVYALELEEYVHLCITKPNWFFDDKAAHEFMSPAIHCYAEPK